MKTLNALPLACTLLPDELTDRLASLRQLASERLPSLRDDGVILRLRYRLDAARQVQSMWPRNRSAARICSLT